MAYHASLAETPCDDPECLDPLCFGRWDAVRERITLEDAADNCTQFREWFDANLPPVTRLVWHWAQLCFKYEKGR